MTVYFKKLQFLNTLPLNIDYAQGILPSKFHLVETTIIICAFFPQLPEMKTEFPLCHIMLECIWPV